MDRLGPGWLWLYGLAVAGCGRTHVTSLLSVLPVIDVVSVNVAGDSLFSPFITGSVL